MALIVYLIQLIKISEIPYFSKISFNFFWFLWNTNFCHCFQKNPDVLSSELSPEPMKTEAPMHIHIKEGDTPRKVTTARRVSLRYECEAEKTVQELIENGLIVPANETTDWCSPAFFVRKGDKIRVRLVTDYTELNKHVKCPIHPFSSTKEILQAVPKNAKVFGKLDAIHRFFFS